LQENAAQIKALTESHKEFAEDMKAVKESHKELAAETKELKAIQKEAAAETKELKAFVKELSRQIGGVHRTLGRLTEEEYSAKLWKKFTTLGYGFTDECQRKKIRDGDRVLAEVDVYFENSAYVMPAEIKTDLIIEDVDDHLKRMAVIRKYMDNHGDKRRVVGAVAGGIAPESVIRYAQKKGLYVVVQNGESVELAEAPTTFKAVEM
jgi:chromosome segregation ATPase